jgi:hypothetical protein
MTVTRTKLERPAAIGDFALSVDDVFQPSRVSASRSTGAGAPFEEVATRSYAEISDPQDLVEWLVSSVDLPTGAARALVVQLTEKVHAATLRA